MTTQTNPTFTPSKEPVLKVGAVTLSTATVLSAFAAFNIPVSDHLKIIIVAAIYIVTHAAGLWAARKKVFSPATVSNALDDLRQQILRGGGNETVAGVEHTVATDVATAVDVVESDAQPLVAPAPETGATPPPVVQPADRNLDAAGIPVMVQDHRDVPVSQPSLNQ